MAHERMFDAQDTRFQNKINAFHITKVERGSAGSPDAHEVTVYVSGTSTGAWPYATAEETQAAFDLWVRRAEDAR